MLIELPTTQEVEITHVLLELPVRYETEDIPNDFPFRRGNLWKAKINIETGQIEDWPKGFGADMHLKVVDGGTYSLLDKQGKVVACLTDAYVPHGVVPGSYGDYVHLIINPDGVVTNWPRNPDVYEFLEEN